MKKQSFEIKKMRIIFAGIAPTSWDIILVSHDLHPIDMLGIIADTAGKMYKVGGGYFIMLMIANMEPNDDRLMEPGHDRANGARK